MRLFARWMCLGMMLAWSGTVAQEIPPPREETDRKLPNGKSQNEEILKAEYGKSLKDAAALVELSQSLQKELEANNSHVLSIASLKKAEEIERIAKRIPGRLLR